MELLEKKLNHISVNTWNWLGVNGTTLQADFPTVQAYSKKPVRQNSDNGVTITDIGLKKAEIKFLGKKTDGAVSTAMMKFVEDNQNGGYFIEIAADRKRTSPVIIEYKLDEQNPTLVDEHFILAHANSEATIIIYYSSDNSKPRFHSGITKVFAEPGAIVHVIKVQMLADRDTHVDAVGAMVGDAGQVHFTLLELGALQTISNCKTCLTGSNSSGTIKSIYFGDQQRTLDINYVVTHQGRKSSSEIEARGVLMDHSQKIFRGTLDFSKGSSGSKGKEAEYTVLLSPTVRNRSVPLMLSGEDDVEGHHAVSIGKLDENKLFYLMSRGISEVEAKKLTIEAAFLPIIETIPVTEIKEAILAYIRRRLNHV
jgi:FeS assembly protein SufD